MKRSLFTSLFVLCGILWPLASLAAGGPERLQPISPPIPMPEVRFTAPDNEITSLHPYRGQVVVLNFWATWCMPCVREMPSLDRLAAQTAGNGVAVVTVSLDKQGGTSKIRRFFEKRGLTNLPVLLEREFTVTRYLKPRGLPLTMILDRSGRAISMAYGGIVWDSPAMLMYLRSLKS